MPRGHVWKPIKALYELVQAPRAWYKQLNGELIRLCFQASSFDSRLYINDQTKLTICVWVDDLQIYGSTDMAIDAFLSQFPAVFDITNEDVDSTYLPMVGTHIHQRPNGSITINQSSYTRKILERFNMNNVRLANTLSYLALKLIKATGPVNETLQNEYLKKFG